MTGVATVKTALFNEAYHASYDYVSDYTAFTILQVLKEEGLLSSALAGEQEIISRLGGTDANIPLVRWALLFLEQQLFIRKTDPGVWETTDKGKHWTDRGNPFPAVHVTPSLDLIRYVGSFWLKALRDEVEPRQVLFNRSGAALWERYFHNAHDLYAVHNQWAAEELADLMTGPCEVLELGTGFGSATRALLTEMRLRSKKLLRYTVTDASTLLAVKARRSLETELASDKLRHKKLDLNDIPAGEGEHDFIFAVNVMHCADQPVHALSRLREHLKPGGSILLSECVRRDYRSKLQQEFIFSMLPDFREVGTGSGDLTCFGLLRPEDWWDIMQAAGFGQVEVKVNEGPVRGAIITGTREK
ncbi:methyltransferase [Paenibacillus lutrae]|uniref:Methyltransferase n=1 Tax=Paenibacillus lutrae TaxID=2078573 RepID=A0A7X3JYB0_9BACL|nr:methyltransferase [Paenibacillus lutrae]